VRWRVSCRKVNERIGNRDPWYSVRKGHRKKALRSLLINIESVGILE
jgi:hypothetical protein